MTHAHDDHLQPEEIVLCGLRGEVVAPHDVAAGLSGDVTAVAPGDPTRSPG